MTDIRILNGTRPSGQMGQQIVSGYVSLNQPAPAGFDDPLYVVIPSLTSQESVRCDWWPKVNGGTLPSAGQPVTIAFDERRVPHVIGWEGPYSPPPLALQANSLT